MLRQWFLKQHGAHEAHQFDLYRCDQCKGLVTHRMIAKGGCSCVGSHLHPTNPTTGEFFRLMVMPWTVR